MNATRRSLLVGSLASALLVACATTPVAAPSALAPTGTLRVGVYLDSPTSLVRGPGADEMRGVSVDLGRELARRLGVPVEIVVHARVAEVVEALKAGRPDVTVTNASPARARELDFTAPLIAIELGYLTLPGSPVVSVDSVDRAGARIGVSEGSSLQAALSQMLKQAVLVPAPALAAADVQKALASPSVKALLASAGGEVVPGTPEQFGSLLQAERVRYEKLSREAGIKPD